MSGQHNGFRSIVESAAASQQLEDAKKTFERVEDAWIGISWRLARGPDAGVKVGSQTDHYVIKFPSFTRLGINLPSITVLYRFDDDQVEVVSLKITDE